jgi:hypothetical protein
MDRASTSSAAESAARYVTGLTISQTTPLVILVNWLVGDAIVAIDDAVAPHPLVPICHVHCAEFAEKTLSVIRRLTNSGIPGLDPVGFRRSVPGCDRMSERVTRLIEEYRRMGPRPEDVERARLGEKLVRRARYGSSAGDDASDDGPTIADFVPQPCAAVDPAARDANSSELEIDVLYFLVVLCIGRRDSDDPDSAIVPLYDGVANDVDAAISATRRVPGMPLRTVQRTIGVALHGHLHGLVEHYSEAAKNSRRVDCERVAMASFDAVAGTLLDQGRFDACAWTLWKDYEVIIDYFPYSVETHGGPTFFRRDPHEEMLPSAPMTTARSKLICGFERNSADASIPDAFARNEAFKRYLRSFDTEDVVFAAEEDEPPAAAASVAPSTRRSASTRFEARRGDVAGLPELIDSKFALTADNLRRATAARFRSFVMDEQRRGSRTKAQQGLGMLITHQRIQVELTSLKGLSPMYGAKTKRSDDGAANDRICPPWVLFAVVASASLDGARRALQNMGTAAGPMVKMACGLRSELDWGEHSAKDARVIDVAGVFVMLPPKFLNEVRWVASGPGIPDPIDADDWLRSTKAGWSTMSAEERASRMREILVRWLTGFATLKTFASGAVGKERVGDETLLACVGRVCDAFSAAQRKRGGVPRLMEFLATADIAADFASRAVPPPVAAPVVVAAVAAPVVISEPPAVRRKRAAPIAPPVSIPAENARTEDGKPIIGIKQLVKELREFVAKPGDVILKDPIADVRATLRQSVTTTTSSADPIDRPTQTTSETVVGEPYLYGTFIPKEIFLDDMVCRRHISAAAISLILRSKLATVLNPLSRRILELAMSERIPTQLHGIRESMIEKMTVIPEEREIIRSDPATCSDRFILFVILNACIQEYTMAVKRLKEMQAKFQDVLEGRAPAATLPPPASQPIAPDDSSTGFDPDFDPFGMGAASPSSWPPVDNGLME